MIAAAVAGIASSAYGAYRSTKKGNAGTATSTTEQEYPEETRNLFRDVEKPLLEGSLDEQQNLLTPFLGGSPYAGFLQRQYGQAATKQAQGSVKGGGASAGIGDTGEAMLGLEGLPPVLLGALKNLAFQNAAQRTTAVPAGYGNFLAPSQTTKSESSSGSDPVGTGFQLASSLTSIGASLYGAG